MSRHDTVRVRGNGTAVRGGLGTRVETIVIQPVEATGPKPPATPNRLPPPHDINTLTADDDGPDRECDPTRIDTALTVAELRAAYEANNPDGLTPAAWVAAHGLTGDAVDDFVAWPKPASGDDTAEHEPLRAKADTVEIPVVPAAPPPPPPGLVDFTARVANDATHARVRKFAVVALSLVPMAAATFVAPLGLGAMAMAFLAACGFLLFVGPAVYDLIFGGLLYVANVRFWGEAVGVAALAVGTMFIPWFAVVWLLALSLRVMVMSSKQTAAPQWTVVELTEETPTGN